MAHDSLARDRATSATLKTSSASETRRLGEILARGLEPGDVLALAGDLGSGKTNFVKGLARGLGVKESVHSPTFILANEYRSGRIPLFHIDAYRVSGAAETLGFGFEDYLDDSGVTVIEWAERIGEALPAEHLLLQFADDGDTRRTIGFTPRGERYTRLLGWFLQEPPVLALVSEKSKVEDGRRE